MIAYLMRLSSTIFGNTFFAINVVGVACGAGICYCIYKTGILLRDQTTGLLAASLWVVSPAVTNWLFLSPNSPRASYLLPSCIGMALLTSDILVRYHYHRTIAGLLSLYVVISLTCLPFYTRWGLLIPTCTELRYQQYSEFLIKKDILLAAKKRGITTILTAGWPSVAQLNFLTRQMDLPPVVIPKNALDMGFEGTYQFLDMPTISLGQFKEALYINSESTYPGRYQCWDNPATPFKEFQNDIFFAPYFKSCTPLKTTSYSREQIITHKPLTGSVVESDCSN